MILKLVFISTEWSKQFFNEKIFEVIALLKKQEYVIPAEDISVTSINLYPNNLQNTTEPFLIKEKSLNWQEDDYCNIEQIECGNSTEGVSLPGLYTLAEHLHSFIDDNLVTGETVLHVFWCIENYVPCPSEAVELYGIFERMNLWHNGQIHIITKNIENIEEWLSFLPLSVLDSSVKIVEGILRSLWHGTLTLSIHGKAGLTNVGNVVLQTELPTSAGTRILNDWRHRYILPVAEVFSEVSLDTIPLAYIQQGSLCQLSAFPFVKDEDAKPVNDVLRSLTYKQGVGTLFRLRHSPNPPVLQGMESTDTECWKQRIAEGNFDLSPNWAFEGSHEVSVFLMLPNLQERNLIDCVALQDPFVFGEDLMKLLEEEQLRTYESVDKLHAKISDLAKDTPFLSNLQVVALSFLFRNYSDVLTKDLKDLKVPKEILTEEKKELVERLSSEEMLKTIIRFCNLGCTVGQPNTKLTAEIRMPKESWPEYEALLQREKKRKNSIARISSGDFLYGLAPPAPPRLSEIIDVQRILKSFENGLGILSNDSNVKSTSVKVNGNFDWLKILKWREAIDCKYHGIYYNSTQRDEKREASCNLLREQVVRWDTFSCFSSSQDKENYLTTKNRRKRQKAEINRSASKRPLLPTKTQKSSRPLNDDDSCSVASSSTLASRLLYKLRGSKNYPPSESLRRSPRKRPSTSSQELKKPSQLFRGSTSETARRKPASAKPKPIPTPADLSEVHKQKLRNVILSVLDQEGVPMKHALFKLCFKKMFMVCKPFALDVVGLGETTKNFEKIAKSHVKQVVQFEKKKSGKR